MRIFLTGCTGTFGTAFLRHAPALLAPALLGPVDIVAFSRDELKQAQRAPEFPGVRWVLGDVRDPSSVRRAMAGCDVVVHAAALKRVDAVVNDPWQAVLTNVVGTRNVVEAAVDLGVAQTVVITSDKGVCPTNFYGATKMLAEQLATSADIASHHRYGERERPRVCCARYGNVIGSRGSVVHIWRRQAQAGVQLTLTDTGMTRFWLTIEQAVAFVVATLARMHGGEVFVPVLPTLRLLDLLIVMLQDSATVSDVPWRESPNRYIITGFREGGEKLHEVLVGEHEAARTVVWTDGVMAILPWGDPDGNLWEDCVAGPEMTQLKGQYDSETNTFGALTPDEIRAALRTIPEE